MKVVHVITGLGQGGAETMLYKLLSNMDQKKFQPSVISLRDEGVFGEKIKKLGIPVYCLGMKSSFSIFSMVRSFYQYIGIIRKIRPNVIQAWMYHANFFAAMVKPFFSEHALIFNIRCSVFLKGSRSRSLFIKLNAIFSRWAVFVVNNSKLSQQEHWRWGFPKAKDIYIGNGFNTEKFKPSREIYFKFRMDYHLPERIKIIANFSRFHCNKNHLGLLEVFKLIKEQCNQPVVFILGGNDVLETNKVLTQKIHALGLDKNCILLGPIEVSSIMPAVDVFVSASWAEGFPNAIGEAMACGVPCVATNVGDCKEIIGDLGGIAEPSDYQKLADQTLQWLNADPETRLKIRQIIIDKYSIKKIVKAYEDLYLSVMNKN